MAVAAAASLRCGQRFLSQEAWSSVAAASAHPLFWKIPIAEVHSKKEGSSICRPGMGVYNGIKAVVPVAWSSRLYITLVRGLPGTRKLHRRTLKALGLQKCQRTVVKDNTSSIRGMINQVKRLVAVETEAMHKVRKQREFELQTLRPPIVVHHPHPIYSPVQLSQQQEGQLQS